MNIIDSATHFQGSATFASMVPSAGCVLDSHVGAGASIATSKLVHKHRKSYGQSGTAASATIPIHVAIGATLTIVAIKAGSIAACTGNATITVDLKKNGTTCLTGVITLDSANSARVVESGTLSVTSGVAGDFFELVIVATVGTGALGTGLLVEVEFDETAV